MSARPFRDRVLIGICTFRRPELADHLGGAPQIEIYGTVPGRPDDALRLGPGER